MEISIEQGPTINWEPPTGEVMTPGFRATHEAIGIAYGGVLLDVARQTQTRRFIDELEKRGYCIAKYEGD